MSFLGRSLLLAVGLLLPSLASAADFAFYHENVMGTSMELRLRADDARSAREAEGRVLAEIDRLAALFSGYDPASEFRRWQDGGGTVRVSPELFEVLDASDRWRERSGGAFDPRAEALTRLWTDAARRDRLPDDRDLAATLAAMSRPAWALDRENGTARRIPGVPLTLNAIAKGYIVDKAADAGKGRGIGGLLLNVGGDLLACGDLPRTIGVAPPRGDSESAEPFTYFTVQDRSVATSGDSQRGLMIAGRWYSHIFDPRTGRPVEKTVSATVIAPRGADADALATIFNVLTVDESLRLAASLPDVECLLVAADGRVFRSAGWARHEVPRPVEIARLDNPKDVKPPASWWGNTHELAVDFEINRPEDAGGRYRRPYVVVWVESAEGVPVRTVSLWVSLGGSGPDRWLPDLKRWYREEDAEGAIARKNMVFTIARPTRQPGKYSVVWDGKDDLGKPLPAGEYTVSIEAAREHGTHQLMRKKVTIGGKPSTAELKGDVEIKAATIAYRAKRK